MAEVSVVPGFPVLFLVRETKPVRSWTGSSARGCTTGRRPLRGNTSLTPVAQTGLAVRLLNRHCKVRDGMFGRFSRYDHCFVSTVLNSPAGSVVSRLRRLFCQLCQLCRLCARPVRTRSEDNYRFRQSGVWVTHRICSLIRRNIHWQRIHLRLWVRSSGEARSASRGRRLSIRRWARPTASR